MSLPQPADLTSLVLRTDFGDDAAWEALKEAVDSVSDHSPATWVSDPEYAGTTVRALVDADTAADEDEQVTYFFLADAATMADPERALLAVDCYDEPGRTFRVPPLWFFNVSANLSLANMDFADYADAVDDSGTFRGFDEE